MSTRIVDKIVAVKIAAQHWGEQVYVVCEKGGDNNVFNTRTGKRSSEWSVIAIGDAGLCMTRACDRCGACVGGCMVFKQGVWTKPEAYIVAWRKAIAEAQDYSALSPFHLTALHAPALFKLEDRAAWFVSLTWEQTTKFAWKALEAR